MRKIRDVLRLKLETHLSHERTAAALNISKGVVTKYVTLATAAGLDWDQIQTSPMATPNCSTYGHPNCPRQDGQIMGV